jgi:hypothetical protein
MLDGEARLDILVAALRDPSPRVSAEGRDRLQPWAGRIVEPLHALMQVNEPLHVRRNVLALVPRLGKWVSVRFLIEAATDDDPAFRATACQRLSAWIMRQNRSMVAPTRTELLQIGDLLQRGPSGLDEITFTELQAVLRPWND